MMNLSVCYFLHDHREASVLTSELPEESDQFRFLHASCFINLKGAVGLIMAKASSMWISIPLDLSSRSCVPLPRFIRFMPTVASTSGRLHCEFVLHLFLQAHRETDRFLVTSGVQIT